MSDFKAMTPDELEASMNAVGVTVSPEAKKQMVALHALGPNATPEEIEATIRATLAGMGRAVRQAITVRARWKKGAKTCDLLAGRSNVLEASSCAFGPDGKMQTLPEGPPHLPVNHAFYWSGIELVMANLDDEAFIRTADFHFNFGSNPFLTLPAPLLFGEPYEVGYTTEQAGIQRPAPTAFLEQLGGLVRAQAREDGEDWKEGDLPDEPDEEGERPDIEDGEDWKEGDLPDEPDEEGERPDIASLLGLLMNSLGADPRAYHPVEIHPLEHFTAQLVAEEPAPADIDLIFVMHGVLLRPLPDYIGVPVQA